MKKLVNGKYVTLSAKEEAKIRAEWEANSIKTQAKLNEEERLKRYPTIHQFIDAYIKKEKDNDSAAMDALINRVLGL